MESGRSAPSSSESHYDEVFHIMASVAALFGYPPPPRPRTLRKNPDWAAYVAKKDDVAQPIPDVEFYGDSPYARPIMREEARAAIRTLRQKIEECRRQKDRPGEAGVTYLAELVQTHLTKVEQAEESPGEKPRFWTRLPGLEGWGKKRKAEGTKPAAEEKPAAGPGAEGSPAPAAKARPEPGFFQPQSEMELKAIYHTLRAYVLDENIGMTPGKTRKVGRQVFQTFTVQKETDTSAAEAFEFNKWLGLFFSNVLASTRSVTRVPAKSDEFLLKGRVLSGADVPVRSGKAGSPEAGASDAGHPNASEASSEPGGWSSGQRLAETYTVIGLVAEGDTGLVHRVWHERWATDLVLKSPPGGWVATEEARAALLRQVETWASLGIHPNVASCFHARDIDGLLRILIEYVDGRSLEDCLKGGPVRPVEWALDLALQICAGLAHAHSTGRIHGDVRPGNCIVTEGGVVKVTDFGTAFWAAGLVKPEEAASAREPLSRGGRALLLPNGLVAAPEYLAPELWDTSSPSPGSVASDVYAAGVTIHELLCGVRPFDDSPTLLPVLRLRHQQSHPLPPSTVRPELPRSTDAVILRALAKDPARRFSTVEEMRLAVAQVFQEVTGRPYSKRAPDASRLHAGTLNNRALSLLDFGQSGDAAAELEHALEAENSHLEANYNRSLLLWRSGQLADEDVVNRLAETGMVASQSWRASHLQGLVHLERRDIESAEKALQQACQQVEAPSLAWSCWGDALSACGRCTEALQAYRQAIVLGGDVSELQMRAAATHLRTGNVEEARVILGDAEDGSVRHLLRAGAGATRSLPGPESPIAKVDVSGDGQRGVALGLHPRGKIRAFDLTTGDRLFACELDEATVVDVALSACGNFILGACSDRRLRLWDIAYQRQVRCSEPIPDDVVFVALFGEKREAVSVHPSGLIRIWDKDLAEVVRTSRKGPPIRTIAFDRAGAHAVSTAGNSLVAWELGSGTWDQFSIHPQAISVVALGPDARYALTAGQDHAIRVWDFRRRNLNTRLQGHAGAVVAISFCPDGRTAVSVSRDQTLRIWDVETSQCLRTIPLFCGNASPLRVTADGRSCLCGGWDRAVRVVDLGTPWPPAPFALAQAASSEEDLRRQSVVDLLKETAVTHLASGQWAEAADFVRSARKVPGFERDTSLIRLWDQCGRGGRRTSLRDGWRRRTLIHPEPVSAVAFGPDGHTVISGSANGTLRVWDLLTGRLHREAAAHSSGINAVAVSRDGRTIYTAAGVGRGGDCTSRVWATETLQQERSFTCAQGVRGLAPSPDGHRLLLCSHETLRESPLRLFDLTRGELLREFEGPHASVAAVDIHPGGRWAVSGNDDGTLATWDMATGSRRASLEAHSDRVTALVFAADGRQFLSASLDGSARLWDASRTRTEGVIECPCGIASADLSPDGSFAVLGGVDGSVQIWHLPRNERLREFRSHGQEVRSLRFSRDGHFAASASPDKSVIVWELDWDYEFPEISEDVASARPFITNLLLRRTDLPSGTEAAAIWTEDDFQTLMDEMCLCGLGWMDFDAVRAELERMAEEMRA